MSWAMHVHVVVGLGWPSSISGDITLVINLKPVSSTSWQHNVDLLWSSDPERAVIRAP